MGKRTEFSGHARMRMQERGTTDAEVIEAIEYGKREPAQRGLVQYRHNVEYNNTWAGRDYAIKQVMPVVAIEEDRLVVVTVYAFFFQEEESR